VPDEVKKFYLAARETVVTTRVDGVPHRVLSTPFVTSLERSRPRVVAARRSPFWPRKERHRWLSGARTG
jgi:NAD(P)H-dependent flavin oxidoreductase YrpB (nitropropane dioxygenase family)